MRVLYCPLPTKRVRQRMLGVILVLLLGSMLLLSLEGIKKLAPVTSSNNDPLYQVNTTKPLAALAINVAWGEEYIPDLLQALKEAETTATFFMVGDWAEQFPDITAAIAADNHELGNHSWSHPYPTQIESEELAEEISKTEKLIQELTGQKCSLFAPPYGEWDKEVVLTAAKLGYRTVMWTIDTIDWQQPGVDTIVRRVLDNLVPGSIILMHPTDQTVKALPQILSGAKEKGFKFITVSQLITEAAN